MYCIARVLCSTCNTRRKQGDRNGSSRRTLSIRGCQAGIFGCFESAICPYPLHIDVRPELLTMDVSKDALSWDQASQLPSTYRGTHTTKGRNSCGYRLSVKAIPRGACQGGWNSDLSYQQTPLFLLALRGTCKSHRRAAGLLQDRVRGL